MGKREVHPSTLHRRAAVRPAAGGTGLSNQLHRTGSDSQVSAEHYAQSHVRNDVAPAIRTPMERGCPLLLHPVEDTGSETGSNGSLTE
ncbi:hypothetical protein ACFWWM_37110 [Streptomyces sp. NPDC058682]|uniref:hypothetical protein n=1 Tax=Streptomyces sp. NPDC058682 TaxID=3346596 RepID=UPI00365D103F